MKSLENLIGKKGALVRKEKGGLELAKMRTRIKKLEPSAVLHQKKKAPALQLCMMFDITVSMYAKFSLIREKLREIVTIINSEHPNSEYSIMAFRNHGDEKKYEQIYYSTPLTANIEEIRSTISTIKSGGGGSDALTCMEECFREANQLNWDSSVPKAIVIVGDMPPHGVIDNLSVCPNEICYINEINQFISKGISVYSVYCGNYDKVRNFYQQIAEQTNGKFLDIEEIDLLSELMIGICMKQTGTLEKYISKLRKTKRLSLNAEKVFYLLE